MSIIAYSLLLVILGYLARGVISGAWRRVRSPHRLSDPDHYWVEIEGRSHAFTDDQLEVAARRAEFLDDPRRRLRRIFAWGGIILALVVIMLAGCRKAEPASATLAGAPVPAAALPLNGWVGDTAYATVNSPALPALHANFKAVLFDQGLVKWDERYDCNHFASLWIALARTRYAVEAWHSSTAAQTLALAEVWYLRGGQPGRGHAIVAASTDAGLRFIEPQTGALVTLTDAERASITLVKW